MAAVFISAWGNHPVNPLRFLTFRAPKGNNIYGKTVYSCPEKKSGYRP
jgi:hypothetical protein